MTAEIRRSQPQCRLLPRLLRDLTKWEDHPSSLTEAAYGWCSDICECYDNLTNGQDLLFLSLEIGFRHLDPDRRWMQAKLTHTNHHKRTEEIIFASGDCDAIGDLLHAWTLASENHGPRPFTYAFGQRLFGLSSLKTFTPRLRRLIIHSVELIGRFKPSVEMGGLLGLLDSLRVGIEDMDDELQWMEVILYIIRSDETPVLCVLGTAGGTCDQERMGGVIR